MNSVSLLVLNGISTGFERLVGCLGFNGPLRQYFSLYRAVALKGQHTDKDKIKEHLIETDQMTFEKNVKQF